MTEIEYDNVKYQAAICQRCGAKMFPVSLLDIHQRVHAAKDEWAEKRVTELRHIFGRMERW